MLVTGLVEWQGPDPQGTAVRTDQLRRQSRRRRQGVVLLPRRHAKSLVPEDALQVSAGGFPLFATRRRKPQARRRTKGIRAAGYGTIRRRSLFRRFRRICEGDTRRDAHAN